MPPPHNRNALWVYPNFHFFVVILVVPWGAGAGKELLFSFVEHLIFQGGGRARTAFSVKEEGFDFCVAKRLGFYVRFELRGWSGLEVLLPDEISPFPNFIDLCGIR